MSGLCQAQGWLYEPAGAQSGLPGYVYFHGSGLSHPQSESCEWITRVVAAGYVVFNPTRRGVSSPGPGSQAADTTGIDASTAGMTAGGTPQSSIDAVKAEIVDVGAALHWLSTVQGTGGPLVDATKIALVGHSIGGALVTFAAAINLAPTPAVLIDQSGGVLSWEDGISDPTDLNSPGPWKTALDAAAAAHNMPVLMYQTTNESPKGVLGSTVEPFTQADASGTGDAQMAVFSAVPNVDASTCGMQSLAQCAHLRFVQNGPQVQRWVPLVLDFMSRHGVR
jgi:fermentation-respiration switch protein FrsA (DUF1100 family)